VLRGKLTPSPRMQLAAQHQRFVKNIKKISMGGET
jgi:hypothetical protein